MRLSFSDEQIIGMIKEYEAGVKAPELYCKYGISDATSTNTRPNLAACKFLRPRSCVFEDENNRLRWVLADAIPERDFCAIGPSTMASAALKDLATKNY